LRRVILAALLLAALLLVGCGTPADPPAAAPGDYRRIAVLGPSTAANLFAAGHGARVVGVSDYCTVPGAADLPRLGGQLDPSLERLAKLDPDLVLVQGHHPRVASWCARHAVAFHAFTTDSFRPGWLEEMSFLGRLLQDHAAFDAVADAVRARLDALVAARGDEPPVPTLLVISRRPGEIGGVMAAGPGTFLSEMLVVAGGRNVLDDDARDYLDLNEETLLRLAPHAVLEFHPGGVATGDEPLPLWRAAFPRLPAVAQGRVAAVTREDALMPGPSMPAAAAAIAAALSPPE